MYFMAYLQTQCLFTWHHGKIKINQTIAIVDLHKSGSSLGAISKHLKVPHSSVQTIVRKYKHHGTTQPSYRSGRRRGLSPRDERTLVWKVQVNPKTTEEDLVKILEETGTIVSISTVKRVLYIDITWKVAQQGRSHCSKTDIKKARLRFATAHEDKDRTFWRNFLWSEETKMELFGHNDHHYVWKTSGRLASWRTPSQPWSMVVTASSCMGALLQEGLVHFTK